MTIPDDKPKSQRLGRGLEALMGEYTSIESSGVRTESTSVSDAPNQIALDNILPNPAQPRREFRDEALADLAASIKTQGVLQPILVRPHPKTPDIYQIVAGERRWRAARKAGLTHIPALVRDINELAVLEIALIENIQRADLNAIEEAEGYQALIERFGRTQENLAETIGKSRAHIANTLRLLNLSPTARQYVQAGRITAGHARAALGASDHEAILERAIHFGWSVRETERQVQLLKDDLIVSGDSHQSSTLNTQKDIDTEALENDLEARLGLRVDIRHKGSKGGEIRVRYRDLEQLDEICRRLSQS